MDRQVQASERVVGPEKRVMKMQQPEHARQARSKQATVER